MARPKKKAKQEITLHKPQTPVVGGDAVLLMIERAALDKRVDVGKMRELFDLRKVVVAERMRDEFDNAMNSAQAEMSPIAADASNPQTKSKYASYLALDKALRPIYTRHGFSVSFNTAPCDTENTVRIVADVSRKGHKRSYQIDMPADGKGAKGGDVMTKTHAVGAAATYGQRYLLKMIFNIAVGEDADGNGASAHIKRITQEQADQIRDLLEAHSKSREKFLSWAKIERIEDLDASFFDAAVAGIKAAPVQK